MVDVLGHFAMALLWAVPAWLLWDGRVAATFVLLTATTAMLPDVDLALQGFLPVHHHGVTHTVLFVTVVAVVAGAIVELPLAGLLDDLWLRRHDLSRSPGALFVFAAGAFLLGGLSHVFADVLSAPDISEPVEPFWPLLHDPVSVDVAYYTSPWWNEGLLLFALAVHLVVGYVDVAVQHPYRIERVT